ncbi:SDR family NAD(P)-dependent oxidoreductase [Nonomuraea sp. H19]|uniref:SDR family NAD(P)-dependent oxidoreductase n=1 Tax=Nonomuraea sp. H19 TaxID=3452206 RepID=UPI003F88A7B0
MDRRIALVGIGARLPGGRGPAGVWRMLQRRESEIGAAPASRLPFLTDHDVSDPAFDMVCLTGGFADGWDEFDHSAFGISAREAEVMDPQQRILVETVFEAIGDAGFTLDYLQRRSTGVVSGCITRDHWLVARQDSGLDAISNVGNTGSGLSGRLSHVFGLTGPSVTLDTACSSGLAAVATAIDNLLVGNCSIAIAAATNLVLDPYETLSFYRSNMLAADGHCKFGTTRADGFVRSDGFAAVVLRPLADALAERDRVYAVIEGVAVGNDGGRSGSLPTPSVDGQTDVIRRALTLAGRAPEDVDYVEAHGTGTTVGDATEIDALMTVFGERDRPLPIGSVKTRIGHCESTSGLAGLVVAALSIHHATVPPMLAHGDLRDDLADRERGVYANVGDGLPLPGDTVIGVSSFGITGTNAHAVLASPPAPVEPETETETGPEALPSLPRLSSPGVTLPAAPAAGDGRLSAALAYRVNHTAGHRRTDADLPVTASGPGLIAGLWRDAPKVVFAFGGFGAHWLDPGTAGDPILRDHLRTTYAAVRDHLAEHERPLLDGGAGIPAALQPYATWASQLAIAFTLRDYGVRPDAVLGHSFGDIAAACTAGALDLETAARLLVARTEAVREHSDNTRMIVITGEDVARDSAWIPASADVAVVNSPSCVVLACPADALGDITERAVAHGHDARALEVVFGSHSRFVEPALPAFAPAVEALGHDRTAAIPFYSSTSTAAATAKTAVAARHWLDNLRTRVDLPPVAARLADDGYQIILDVGPRAVLAGHLQASFGGTVLTTDAIEDDDFLRATIGALFTANVPLRPHRLPRWTSVLAAELTWRRTPRSVSPLRPAGRAVQTPGSGSGSGSGWGSGSGESVTYRLRGPQVRLLAGHRVRGETVAPGTLTLSYLVRSLRTDGEPLRIDAVRFVEPIVIDDTTDQLALTVSRDGSQVEVHFTTDPAATPTLCCTATVAQACPAAETAAAELPLNLAPLPVDAFYEGFAAAGNVWEGPFRSISELWVSTTHAYATAELGTPTGVGGEIDPALFDAALHGLAAVHYGLADGAEATCPFYFEGVDRMTFHRHRLHGRTRSVIAPSADGTGFDITILDAEDRLAVRCEGVRIRTMESRPAIPALHRIWVPYTGSSGRAEQRLVDLFDAPLGTADPDVIADVVARTGPGRELLIDARTPAAPAQAQLTGYLAGLGQAVTRLAHAAAEAGVPLGVVVTDPDQPPADELGGAVSGFLFALAGALPYEFPALAGAVVCAPAGDPLGDLPSIRDLAARGEHRLRRDSDGGLSVARLTDQPKRSRPRHPAGRHHLGRWTAEVRLHEGRACDVELVWSDPRHGPRAIGIRPLPQGYRQARRLPDVLWAVQAAQRITAVVRPGADDELVISGDPHRAALLRAALATRPGALGGQVRRIGIALDEPLIGPLVDTATDLLITAAPSQDAEAGAAEVTLRDLAPTSAWPRSVAYRTTFADTEIALLDLAGADDASYCERAATSRRRRAALIVGGSGGLGSALAADLRARSFTDIVLVGTRDNPGSGTGYLRCDISDPAAVALLTERLARIEADEVLIFHLAGRLSAGPLAELDPADWHRVLAPKTDGTRHVVEVARRTGARMLVAYSSASAVLPSPQFGHYGAANAAMEGILAAVGDVRVRGVRWGFWAGAGMLRDLDPTRSFTPAGVGEIGANDGHDFLWNVLTTPDTGFPVCYPADWAEFGGRYETLRRDALLSLLRPAGVRELPQAPAEAEHQGPTGRTDRGDAANRVESLIMETLKISEVSVVRGADRLRDLGLDSLLAVELRTKIKAALGHTVPIRTLLGPTSPAQLLALVTETTDTDTRSA